MLVHVFLGFVEGQFMVDILLGRADHSFFIGEPFFPYVSAQMARENRMKWRLRCRPHLFGEVLFGCHLLVLSSGFVGLTFYFRTSI